jgi:hypothetical protein
MSEIVEVPVRDANENDQLSGYIGSVSYYKYLCGTQLTDGSKAAAELYECFWFLDIIASIQYMPEVHAEGFQVFKLERVKDDHFKVTMEDGNDNVIYTQNIAYSDFKDDILTLWVVDKIIMLPSEY